jgi:prophage antirepressor-like protein
MNELQSFNFNGVHGVRVVMKDGNPWFVAKDVCECLEIDTTQTRRLDDDEKGLHSIQTPGGDQVMIVVSEPGLYSLIMTSRKPEAKRFKKWVTSDVLPTIRQTGQYSISEYRIPQTYAEALQVAADLAKENERLLPRAEFHDRLMSAEGLYDMKEVSKVLNYKRLGPNNIFKALVLENVLYKRRDNYAAYQPYIERGYFVEKATVFRKGDDDAPYVKVLVTAKGLDWLDKFLEGRGYTKNELKQA